MLKNKYLKKWLVCLLATSMVTSTSMIAFGETTSNNNDYFESLKNTRVNSEKNIKWQQIGPGSQGGADFSMFHPTDPNYLYICQNMTNSYISTDGLKNVDTWESIADEDGLGKRFNYHQIYQSDFSRQNENFGLAVNKFGLLKTEDKGVTWSRTSLDTFPDLVEKSISLSAVRIDPTNDNILYVGVGNFWQNVDPRTKKKPYKTTAKCQETGKIYKSTDGGKTWTGYTEGLPELAEIGQIFVNPKDNQKIYVATSRGFYYSDNGGKSYVERDNGFQNHILRDVDVYFDKETGEATFYAVELTEWIDEGNEIGSKGGVYKSTDEGKTWTSLNDNLHVNIKELSKDAPDLITGSYSFFWTMQKWFGLGSDTLEKKYNLPTSILPSFREIEVDPTNPNKVYIVNCGRKENSFAPEGVWISEDGGKNWFVSTRLGVGYEKSSDYWKNKYSPSDVDMSSQNVSVGGEKEWSWMFDLTYPMLAYQYMDVSPDGKKIIVHAFKSRLMSEDYGRTWKQIDSVEVGEGSDIWIGRGDSNVPGKKIFFQPETNKPMLLAGETGIWNVPNVDYSNIKTTSLPLERIDKSNSVPCPTSALEFDPIDNNVLYTLAERLNNAGKFMKSTDGGKTWIELSKLFDIDSAHSVKAYTLLIEKNNTNNMYMTMPKDIINDADIEGGIKRLDNEYGVYKTTDGGVTWNVSNNGLPSLANVNALAFSNNQKTIYAAMMNTTTQDKENINGGLYKSTDQANNWVKINTPEKVTSVNDVKVLSNGRIIISTGSRAGTIDAGGVWYTDDEGENWTQIFDMPFIIETTIDSNNENRIMVNVGKNSLIQERNTGIYLTEDFGSTWKKINYNLGTSDKVSDMKFDPVDPDILWCSTLSSGFYRTIIDRSVSNAADKIVDGEVNVPYGATQGDKDKAVQEYINKLIGNEVKATIEFQGEDSYKVTLTKGEIIESKVIKITFNIAQKPVKPEPDEPKPEPQPNPQPQPEPVDPKPQPKPDSSTPKPNKDNVVNTQKPTTNTLPTTGSNLNLGLLSLNILGLGLIMISIRKYSKKRF